MTHQFYGEKRQRFSFRKLSVGLVSATIGSFFLSGQITGDLTSVKAAEIQSQQSAHVKYHYVVESELTEAEKSALIREIPKYVEDASETYYLVYRPTTQGDSSGVLPKTGHSGLWESTFTAMGLALLVLVVVRGRNGKRYLSSLLLVTGMGSMLLSPTVLAVTNIELAAYNQSLNLGLGDALPAPLKIDGYDYIGYLKNEEQNDSHLAHSVQKENPTLDWEKEKGSELKPSETNLDMKEIVSDKGDTLTEEEREAIAAKERESARLSTVYDLPELKISEQESVQELPYQTKYQYTDELAQGQSKVIQSGVRGQRTVVTRHFRKDQEIVKSEMISDQVTLEPVSEIILVGTAPTNSIPKETPVHEVPELTEYSTTPETAPVHKVPELTEYGTTPETAPVHEAPELTEYGTSPETSPVRETPELTEYGTSPETSPVHEVPELTEYGTSSDTPPVQEIPELTEYGTSSETSPVRETPELIEYGTTPETAPVHEVPELTEYGTTPETAPVQENSELELTTNDEVRIEKIDFSIDEQYTDEIPEGSRQIVTPGVQGERTIKTRVYSSNGQEVDRQELSNEETLAPVTQIVKVGTAKPSMVPNEAPKADALPEYPLTYTDETRVEKINFSIREEETDELVQDARQIATPGVQGERTIKTRVYSSNGQVVDRQELSNEETLAPVTQIVKVGTAKPNMVPSDAPKADALPEYPLTYTDEIRVEKINFTIREEETDELVRDARQIATPGVQGERTIKTRVYSSNGQEVDRQELSNEETLAPVTQVVKVGTAKPNMVPSDAPKADALPEYPLTYTDETLVEKIAFNIEEQYTDELVRDARQITTPGVQGERTIKTRVYSSNGQVVDRQELSNEETLAPITQIVKVGTAKPTMVPSDAPKADALEEFDLISLHSLLAEANQIKAQARYFNDSQSHQANYDAALTAGQAILSQSQASQAEVNQLVEQINQAKAQLSGLEVVKTALQTEYDLNPTVKTSVKYKNADSEKQTAYTDELTKAEGVLNNQTATQVQVNQALVSLTAAKEALNGVPKVKPTVSILSLTENADDKSVTVQYRLEDQTQSFRSATAELYQGDQLIRTLPITNFAGSLKIGDLDYYTGYTLKTKLTYELDNGSFTEFETDSRNFELEYKKIAFRDIDSVEFYHKENDQYKRFVSMSSMPTDLSTYFVKIKSSESKEILLPVHSIAEAEKDGKAVYKVNVALPELVQESEIGYKSGHDFYISKAVPSQQNVYTSFAGLVDAMKRNMAGNYVLGADLDASEVNLAPADYVYLKGNFTGSLTGSQNGKQYAIYNLAKPLFENLKNGSSITNIDFKDVNIVGTYDSAALARNAENALITDVSVLGRVSVVGNASNVAGLVVNGTNTKITNSSFTGTILSNSQQIKAYNVGGLVANLKGGESLLSQSKADVTIISGARSNEQRIGGLVGRLENNARITKSYVTGKLYNATTSGQIGGVVGSNYFNGLVDNVISNVSGTNVYSISGDQGYKNDRITQAYKVAKSETLKNDQFVTSTITQEEMEEKLTAMDITTSLDDTNLNMRYVDYGEVNNAQFDRGYSYANMEKLLPFYNKETIVSFANKIPKEHKLNKEYLLDVVPMKGDQVITDIHSNKTAINRLMLHYMDNTIDYLEISYQGDFVNQGIAEYSIKGLDLLYTPEAFVSDYTSILNQVLPELNKVVLDSPAMRTALGVAADTSLDELYLDTAFTQVKSKLSGELRKVLAMDKAINTEGEVVKDYLVKKILADK